MFNFVSEKSEQKVEVVPFYEDATAQNGWQGQSTGKTIETLKSDIISSFGKLGGLVTGFEKGSYGNRTGFRVHYVIETPEGKHIPGYMSVAALPLKPSVRHYHYRNRVDPEATRLDKSLRMALFNVAECLAAMWKLQRLSPGFAPLMPFMIVGKGHMNLTEMYSTGSALKALMPPSDDFVANGVKHDDGDVIEGEVVDAEQP